MNGCDLKIVRPRKDTNPLNLMDLPAIKLVTLGIVNLLFARDLTTGDESKDEILKNIIYSVNDNGKSGLDNIKNTIIYSMLYGKGLLVFNPVDERLYSVSPFQYQPYYFKENNLVQPTVMYQIFDAEADTMYADKIRVYNRYEKLTTKSTEYGFYISSVLGCELEEWMNPLVSDRKRAEIVLTALDELLHDIMTGGYGYTLVYGNKSYIEGDEEHSPGEEFNRQAYVRSVQNRKSEVKDMLDDIGEGRRTGGYYYDGYVDKVEQLKRMITPKDYEYFIQKSQQITCEILGIPPILLGLNETSKNVSIDAMLEQANVFFSTPWRQKIENYITKLLGAYIGAEKIYFDDAEDEKMEDEEDGN